MNKVSQEEWRDVVGYEGLYQVSNLGNVRSLFRYKKQLKPRMCNSGYLRVELFKNKQGKWHLVHRLVAEAFIPNPLNKPTVNHKDECKTNNRADNLEWATRRENNIYGTRIAKQVVNTDYQKRNQKINQELRTASFVKPVLQYDKNGNFIKRWRSIAEFCKLHKKSPSGISACCRGLRKSAYGFVWKYERSDDLLAV